MWKSIVDTEQVQKSEWVGRQLTLLKEVGINDSTTFIKVKRKYSIIVTNQTTALTKDG